MKELRKKALKEMLFVFIVLAFVFGFAMYNVIPALMTIANGQNLDEVDFSAEDLDGTYLSGTLYFIYGSYVEEVDGDKTVAMEYIIDGGSDYYIGLRVPKSGIKRAEALMEACFSYLDEEADEDAVIARQYKISGTIRKMPSDSLKYYRDWWDWYNLDEESQSIILPYYLDTDQIGAYDKGGVIGCGCLALTMVAIAIFLLIRVLSGAYQKSITKYISASANPEATREKVENFLSSTPEVNGIKLNNQFFCGHNGARTIFCEISKIVWAYQYTVTKKRNGFTVGHEYSVMLGLLDGKKESVSVANEEQAQAILKTLAENYPHITLGYSDELDKMFRKNREEFLAHYNAVMQQTQNDPFASI